MAFNGATVVVTGACGGIGRSIAARFGAGGARLVAGDRDAPALEQLRHELVRDHAIAEADCLSLAGDLCDRSYCDALIDFAVDSTGRIDVLVNNAGIITRGDILQTSDDDWQRTLDTNLTAVFLTCRRAIGHMKAQGGGAIVNLASTWGLYPGPGHPAYCTSKGAVAILTKCLGRDHAGDGIRINAVCPNEVDTPMLRSGLAVRGFDTDAAIAQLGATIPIGRLAKPEDIADVVCFLASTEARYVAGTTIEVNGAKPVY